MSTLAIALILKPLLILAICLPVRYLATKYLPPGQARRLLLTRIPGHRSSGSEPL